MADRPTALARFRKIRVLGYGRVDDARMHRMLREQVVDADRYVEAVRSGVSKAGGEGAAS